MRRKKNKLKHYKQLENAVYGWFFKSTDSQGDDPAKLAKYQARMISALKKLGRIDG